MRGKRLNNYAIFKDTDVDSYSIQIQCSTDLLVSDLSTGNILIFNPERGVHVLSYLFFVNDVPFTGSHQYLLISPGLKIASANVAYAIAHALLDGTIINSALIEELRRCK